MKLTNPVLYIEIAAILLVVITIVVLFAKEKFMTKFKKSIFIFIVIIVLLPTLYLAGNTVYKNIKSVTGGPIHWHADYQVWVCGERKDLIDPTGLSNKIGTPLFHEHNDDRIHVEGTVSNMDDVTLSSFFRTVGGKLTTNEFAYLVENGEDVNVKSGDSCNGQPSQLKVYVNGQKINNVETYMYYPHGSMPPGDCVIIEFGPNLPDTTTKICDFWAANSWNYENFKELRKEKFNQPSWMGEGWQYIDGQGLVEVQQ